MNNLITIVNFVSQLAAIKIKHEKERTYDHISYQIRPECFEKINIIFKYWIDTNYVYFLLKKSLEYYGSDLTFQVTDTIGIRILEASRINLVEHGMVPPALVLDLSGREGDRQQQDDANETVGGLHDLNCAARDHGAPLYVSIDGKKERWLVAMR